MDWWVIINRMGWIHTVHNSVANGRRWIVINWAQMLLKDSFNIYITHDLLIHLMVINFVRVHISPVNLLLLLFVVSNIIRIIYTSRRNILVIRIRFVQFVEFCAAVQLDHLLFLGL